MKVSTQTRRSGTSLKIKLSCQFPILHVSHVISCNLQYVCPQKKCWHFLFHVQKHSHRLYGVLFWFQQLLCFSRTFHCLNWGRFAQFRPLGPKRPSPTVVCDRPATCLSRSTERASNYINEPRSSGRPRVPMAPDLQQSLLLGAQHVKDFMILNAPCQTKCWIGGSALLYHPHFWHWCAF